MKRDKTLEQLIASVVDKGVDANTAERLEKLGPQVVSEETIEETTEEELEEERDTRDAIDRRYRALSMRKAAARSLEPAAKAKGPMSAKKQAAQQGIAKHLKKAEHNSNRISSMYSKAHKKAEEENNANHLTAAHDAVQTLGGKTIHKDEHGHTYAITSAHHAPILVHIKPDKYSGNGRHDVKVTKVTGSSYSDSDLYPKHNTEDSFKGSSVESHKARISGAIQGIIDSSIRDRSTGWE